VQLVTKGAVRSVLDIATGLPDGCPLDAERREQIAQLHSAWAARGITAGYVPAVEALKHWFYRCRESAAA
jgi:hypothetical protein